MKRVMHAHDRYDHLPDYMQEALEMVCHKIGRILNGDPFYVDSWRDCVGYLQLVVNELEQTEGATDVQVTQRKVINGKWADTE